MNEKTAKILDQIIFDLDAAGLEEFADRIRMIMPPRSAEPPHRILEEIDRAVFADQPNPKENWS